MRRFYYSYAISKSLASHSAIPSVRLSASRLSDAYDSKLEPESISSPGPSPDCGRLILDLKRVDADYGPKIQYFSGSLAETDYCSKNIFEFKYYTS